MTVARSVETRLMWGLHRDFVADADVISYFGAARVFVGPLVEHDSLINPPQINISLSPGDIFAPGAGGVTKDRVPVMVRAYFPISGQDTGFSSSGINAHDYVKHLQLLVLNGSVDPHTGLKNGNGYVLDPDYVIPDPLPSPANALRWVNRYCYGCTKQIAIPMPGNSALVIAFFIDYEAQVNSLTGIVV